MSWTVLTPIAKSTGRPQVSAQIKVSKNDDAKIVIFFSQMLYEEMRNPVVAVVSEGAGDHTGCVLIVFLQADEATSEPTFAFAKGPGGSSRITIPMLTGAPHKATTGAGCSVLEKTADHLVLRLPLAAWEAEGRPAQRQLAAPTAPAPRPAPPVPLRGEDNRIGVVAYLHSKGHKVEPLRNGRVQIDGEVHAPMQVLSKINSHRKQADLPPVDLGALNFDAA